MLLVLGGGGFSATSLRNKTSGIATLSQEMAVAERGVTEAMQSITAIVQANTVATKEMASQSDQVSEAIRGIATVAKSRALVPPKRAA